MCLLFSLLTKQILDLILLDSRRIQQVLIVVQILMCISQVLHPDLHGDALVSLVNIGGFIECADPSPQRNPNIGIGRRIFLLKLNWEHVAYDVEILATRTRAKHAR